MCHILKFAVTFLSLAAGSLRDGSGDPILVHSSKGLGVDGFVRTCSWIPDLDEDGFPDLVVCGAFDAWDLDERSGALAVVSGAEGYLLWRVFESPYGQFVDSQTLVVADWTGDGTSDILVHHRGFEPLSWELVLHDGRNGLALESLPGSGRQGFAREIGDWNGDQVSDVGYWSGPSLAPFTRVLSGADGLHMCDVGWHVVSETGDLDAGGDPDFIVEERGGAWAVVSRESGMILMRFAPRSAWGPNTCRDLAVDVDGDGFKDRVVTTVISPDVLGGQGRSQQHANEFVAILDDGMTGQVKLRIHEPMAQDGQLWTVTTLAGWGDGVGADLVFGGFSDESGFVRGMDVSNEQFLFEVSSKSQYFGHEVAGWNFGDGRPAMMAVASEGGGQDFKLDGGVVVYVQQVR
tara:strand:- start:1037 stop:2251 length:1215 start_codon:yes stop_codon:yes gene_type:complete